MLLKQFGIFNPPEADKRSAFYELLSKSGQNRLQKSFYELVKIRRLHCTFIFYTINPTNPINTISTHVFSRYNYQRGEAT
jgi:hypothetical protein